MKKPVRPGLVPPTEGQRHKRFRLSIVGADEDMPRLVRAYGRACQGEFGLVLRPPEQRGVLVLVTKKDGAFQWRSGDSAASRLVRANAEVLREDTVRLRVLDGEYADSHFAPYEDVPATYKHGDWVEIVFAPGDQFAHLAEQARGGRGVDSPQIPKASVTSADAVASVKDTQKSPPKVGPVTLRGRWTGYLYCEGGLPRVELKRRLATYGTLWVFSNGTDGWAWTFERDSKWFGRSGETYGQGLPTLLDALHIAVLGAMTLVKDACSFRDTHRRAAHDDDYATKHPIRKREPKRNPTDRLKEPKPKKPRTRTPKAKQAPAPKPVNTRDVAPEVPQDRGSLQTMTDTAARAAHELIAVDDVASDWELVESPSQIAAWFDEVGFQGIGESILDYSQDPTYSVAEFLGDVRKDLHKNETVHDDDPDPKLYAEARGKLVALRTALESAPMLLERARKLIRYARSMARSPLCRGTEQKAALKAIDEARAVYENTRAKIRKGHKWDADRTLRRIGEKVALAAAKAAKSCATGQRSMVPPPRAAPKASSSRPKPKPKPRPAKKKPTAEVDDDKDQALIDAFSKAFAAVLGDEAA